MTAIFPGRYTTRTENGLVVFIIGMRVNQLWNVRKWLQTASAMPPMLRELYSQKELGFLGVEQFFRLFPLESLLVSYWQSYEHLESYAKSQDLAHVPAWVRFNQTIGNDGTVGIWHETYIVEGGKYESIYVNMPEFGLGKAQGTIPIAKDRETSRQRITQT